MDAFEEAVLEAARESENSIIECALAVHCATVCVPCSLHRGHNAAMCTRYRRYDKNGHSAHVMLGKGWHLEEQCAVVTRNDVRFRWLPNLLNQSAVMRFLAFVAFHPVLLLFD